METKRFFHSKSMYGLAMIAAGIWLNGSGIPLGSPEALAAAGEITDLITKAGIAVTAWGRATADKKLTL